MSEKRATVITPEFRVSFPSVFEPSEFNGKEKFRITMMFPKKGSNLEGIKELVSQAIKEAWGTAPADLKPWFTDGDKTEYESNKGMWIIKATSGAEIKPFVYGIDGRPLEKDSEEFYAGCWAKAKLCVHTFGKGNTNFTGSKETGIGFYFQGVRKVRDDESFEGSSCSAEDFGPVEKTKGEEDIPF